MNSILYNQDFYLWLQETTNLLKIGALDKLDLSNLIIEIESMGRSEKNAIKSSLIVILLYLLKYKYQPEKRSDSWTNSIIEHRIRIEVKLESSPSLKPYVEEVYNTCYSRAFRLAASETKLPISHFPSDSPFTIEQVLDTDFLPE